jgi:4-carboxymuconolactone decarboxylase
MNCASHDLGESRPNRIPPLAEPERSTRQQEVVDDLVRGPTTNIYTTLVRHPEAAAAMVNLGRTLRGGLLPARHREIIILRTGCNCSSAYELAQHYRAAKSIGMTDDDVERIRLGPDEPGWETFEALLCRACDELHSDHTISDGTWSALAQVYTEQELIETVMLVGYYHLVSFALNALGVEVEPGTAPFPGAVRP